MLDLPLDRVVEIHLSGLSEEAGVHWDDHSSSVPEEVYELLALALRRGAPHAVTLEHNWSSRLPEEQIVAAIERTRRTIEWANGERAKRQTQS
jgi:uncharacterized protein (UPF0276 family)